MIDTQTASAGDVKMRATADERRSTAIGVVLLVLAGVVVWVFGLGTEPGESASFGLGLPGSSSADLKWVVDPRILSFVVAGLLAYLGVRRIQRARPTWANAALGLGIGLFVLSFLAWSAAGQSFSLVGMLRSTVTSSVAITLGALTGLMCERVGVIDIGIEGQLLTSAFVSVVLSSAFGTLAGVVGGMLTGALLGWLLAWLAIRFRVDQIIVGVVINILALGLTSYLASRILTVAQDLNAPERVPSVPIPGLSEIPVLGPMFFDHNLFVYGMFILVGVLQIALFRTRWGLRSRSVGEHPKAADTAGINVYRVRYRNVILGGLIAGFGGAYLALTVVSRFEENLTGGIGFIGLAAMIFGRWMPVGALAAGLLFGISTALSAKLSVLGTPIPSEFLLMIPYVATIVVVAGLVGRARPPAADGQPYIRG
jgi:simple sugar transport system permease protein